MDHNLASKMAAKLLFQCNIEVTGLMQHKRTLGFPGHRRTIVSGRLNGRCENFKERK